MLREDYVSLETAELLKEKGFIWEVHRSYLVNDNCFAPADVDDLPHRKDAIRIPTLQMAMKWLREVHSLHCVVDYDIILGWKNKIISLKETVVDHYIEMKTYLPNKGVNHPSYKEACEEAIKYCLENLI